MHANHPPLRLAAARPRGFTLVEALVTLAILGILAAIALPSMREMIERKRLEGAATDLYSDLRLLRSMRLQFPRDVGIHFGENSQMTCYALYFPGGGSVRDCVCFRPPETMCGTAENTARPELIKLVQLPKTQGITIRSNYSIVFLSGSNALPVQGRMLDVTVQDTDIGALKVKTNTVFTPARCTASGSFGGLPACGVAGSWP